MLPETFLYGLKQRLNAKSLSSGIMETIAMVYDAKFPMEMQFLGEATIRDFASIPNFHNSVPILQLLGIVISDQVAVEVAKEARMDKLPPDPAFISYMELNVQYAVALVKTLGANKWGSDPCTISQPDLVALGAKVGLAKKPDPQ